MRGTFEGMKLYQTIAEPGKEYPPLPEIWVDSQENLQLLSDAIEAAPSVWYVRELTNVSFNPADDVPEITATDTGRRHHAFNMGNGSVLGAMASSRGMTRTFFREGTYLAGFWYNGQLYVIPLMEGYGCTRCNRIRKKHGLKWRVTVPAADDYWISMEESVHTLTDDVFGYESEWPSTNGGEAYITEFPHLYTGGDLPSQDHPNPYDGVNRCRAGTIDYDVDYIRLGDDALAFFNDPPEVYAGSGVFSKPWEDGSNYISVYLRHSILYRQVLVSVTANRALDGYWFGSYIFTALYQAEYKKCAFDSPQVFERTGSVGVIRYNGATISSPLGGFEGEIKADTGLTLYEQAPFQLPESVTVEQV